jgi:1-acyl-sn-glycerol-3-phosphate acyltransferase
VAAERHGLRARLARWVLRVTRWRLVGTVPRRGVVIGAPHTSNWDFVLTLLTIWADDISPHVLVKQEMFWWPMGALMRALGAIETDRQGARGLVERLTRQARESEEFVLVLAPDGTRTPTDHWKSGFYRLTLGSGLPLTLGFVDGPTRTTGVGPTIRLTGDVRADMDRIRDFYADKHGVHPGRGSTVRLREEDRPAR